MIKGLYIAGTGMLSERSRMDVITNNIANTDTLAYKKDSLLTRSFADMLLERMNDPERGDRVPNVGPLNTGVYADELITSFDAGTPENTGLDTDFYLRGPGFFIVKTPEGDRYTRAGNFSVDQNGKLVDANGYFVQGEGGSDITLTSEYFIVDAEGNILDGVTGQSAGKFNLVEFENLGGLNKLGNNLFADVRDAGVKAATETEVIQGAIETSNVNIATEMVNMIITNRAYDSNQQAMRMIDSTLEKAVNEIASF